MNVLRAMNSIGPVENDSRNHDRHNSRTQRVTFWRLSDECFHLNCTTQTSSVAIADCILFSSGRNHDNSVTETKMPTYELTLLVRQMARVSSKQFSLVALKFISIISVIITSSIHTHTHTHSISAWIDIHIETDRRIHLRPRWHPSEIGQFRLRKFTI